MTCRRVLALAARLSPHRPKAARMARVHAMALASEAQFAWVHATPAMRALLHPAQAERTATGRVHRSGAHALPIPPLTWRGTDPGFLHFLPTTKRQQYPKRKSLDAA